MFKKAPENNEWVVRQDGVPICVWAPGPTIRLANDAAKARQPRRPGVPTPRGQSSDRH